MRRPYALYCQLFTNAMLGDQDGFEQTDDSPSDEEEMMCDVAGALGAMDGYAARARIASQPSSGGGTYLFKSESEVDKIIKEKLDKESETTSG